MSDYLKVPIPDFSAYVFVSWMTLVDLPNLSGLMILICEMGTSTCLTDSVRSFSVITHFTVLTKHNA